MYLLIEASSAQTENVLTAAVHLTQKTFAVFLRLCELCARLEQIAKKDELGKNTLLSILINSVYVTNHGEQDFEKDIQYGVEYDTEPYEDLWNEPQRVKALHPELTISAPESGARAFIDYEGGICFRIYHNNDTYETTDVKLELLTPDSNSE